MFVELPKFEQSLDKLNSLMEQWLFFLKHAKELTTIPPGMAQVPALQQAFEFANRANLSPEERDDLEHREMFIHDQRNALKLARRQGQAEGREDEAKSLIVRQLGRKLGALPQDLQLQVRRLELVELGELGEALFDLEGVEDLRRWLGAQRN